jgi:hypothetical protein
VRSRASAVDADDQVRPVRLLGEDSRLGQPVVSERSLDHRRGLSLIPRQIRGRRRDQCGRQRDHFPFPLSEKPLRRGQQPPRALHRADVSHTLRLPLNADRAVQTAAIVSDPDSEVALMVSGLRFVTLFGFRMIRVGMVNTG